MATTNMQTKPCYLLKVAGEIRNLIYEECFENNVIDCDDEKCDSAGLLLSCKQIYKEAKQVFYHHSDFRSATAQGLANRLEKLHPKNLKLVKRISLDMTNQLRFGELWSSKMQVAAFWAQNALIELPSELPDTVETQNAEKQVRFIVAGEVITAATPFKTYLERLEQAHAKEEANGQATAKMDKAVRFAESQMRFFDFEHDEPEECWQIEWGHLEGYDCGCPEKAK